MGTFDAMSALKAAEIVPSDRRVTNEHGSLHWKVQSPVSNQMNWSTNTLYNFEGTFLNNGLTKEEHEGVEYIFYF
ncbi:hypothetical protein P3S68_016221 [Capsicum galapagoense]